MKTKTALPYLKNIDDLINLFKRLKEVKIIDGLAFDMNTEYAHREKSNKTDCGSACCIGGWVQACNPDLREMDMEHALGRLHPYVSQSVFEELCWPDRYEYYELITAENVVDALECIRDTGNFDWDEILDN